MTTKIILNYDERQALATVRKLIQREPEAFGLLMQDMTKAAAVNVLLVAKKEMQDLHTMSKAMVLAASEIVKMDQPTEGESK
jgi:hydrogenase maturation factor HypF (carbamoyltransferase family)